MGNTTLDGESETGLAKRPTNVYQITVAPPPLLKIHLGDVESLGRYVRTRKDAVAVVWSETELRVILGDSSHVLTYRPEIMAEAEQFFHREEKRERLRAFEVGSKVWQGDFEPVKFRRADLRKFLEAHSTDVPADVVTGLSRLKISESEEESGEEGRIVSVSAAKSNFPSKFKVTLEVFPGIATELQFESKVCSLDEGYGRHSRAMGLELRCVNARETLRRAMSAALAEIPDSIPKYYGRSPPPNDGKADRDSYI